MWPRFVIAWRTFTCVEQGFFLELSTSQTVLTMLKFLLLVNKQGHTRVSQYYEYLELKERTTMEAEITRKCLTRNDGQVSCTEICGSLQKVISINDFFVWVRFPLYSPIHILSMQQSHAEIVNMNGIETCLCNAWGCTETQRIQYR